MEIKPTERYEFEYLIPEEWAGAIQRAVEPYCVPDKYTPPVAGRGYLIDGMYLDSPSLCCLRAKEQGLNDRFKLRARFYGKPGTSPLFLEVKRKVGDRVIKHRTVLDPGDWPAVVQDGRLPSGRALGGELQRFVGLAQGICARPSLLVRYWRVAYTGVFEDYSRVTFDRGIQVQRPAGWRLEGDPGQWLAVDHPRGLGARSQVVLELKFAAGIPVWMAAIVRRLELARVGFSKYCSGIWASQSQASSRELARQSTLVLGNSFSSAAVREL